MRPQEAYRIINDALKPFYSHQETLYPALTKCKRKRTMQAIDQMLKAEIDFEREITPEYDLRTGETGCYYEDSLGDEKRVINNLFYMSDRWCCVGRLKFLKRVTELY